MPSIKFDLNPATSKLKPMVEYINKQKDNEKFIHTIELNATILLIIFFVIFAIRPTIITISGLVGEIKAKELEKTQLKSKINQIIKAQDLYSQVQGRYALISQSLPDRPEYYQAATQLISTATNTSNTIDSLTFTPQSDLKPTDHVRSYSVPVNLLGNFDQVSNFVSDLLQNRRLFQVNGVSFSLPRQVSSIGSTAPSLNPGTINLTVETQALYWESKL